MKSVEEITLQELRALPEVQELEHYAKLLATGGFSDPDSEEYNALCYHFSEIIRNHCNNIGVSVQSHWGEDGSFSIYLAGNDQTSGPHDRLPVIADCMMGY